VLVLDDAVPGEAEPRGDDVVDEPAGGRVAVAGLPAGAALCARDLDLAELDREIDGALAEHPPHPADLGAAEVDEDRIREPRVGRVLLGHADAVARPEGTVERLDDLARHARVLAGA